MPDTKARLRCVLFAMVCTALLAGWQGLTVHYHFGGNWTALFYTGQNFKGVPPALQPEGIYVFKDSLGYDGQFYHYLAHDPLLRRNYTTFMDDPRYRSGRILVPGLAFLLAGGRDERIDAAYIAVVWMFVALGAYWLGRLAVLYAYPAWFGPGFALVPAVLVSIDRLTVDVALAACAVGFVLYVEENSPLALYAVLMAAGLVRETGVLLPAAYCIWLAGGKRFREAAVFATSVIPTFAWWLYVDLHTSPGWYSGGFLSLAPFAGLVRRMFHAYAYPDTLSRAVRELAIGLDLVALAGIAAVLVWTARRSLQRAWTPVTIAMYLFALLVLVLNRSDVWSEVFAFGRTLSPLLLLATLDGMKLRSPLPALAMLAL
ncbi:MAG: hypothetical protein ABSB86_14280, partial [Bryobacteraceae bacterium]